MATIMELRAYQSKVVDSVQHVNAIVMMPTGSGKTIVAAEVIRRHLTNPTSRRVLFLVPSVDLVPQQAGVVERWCGNGSSGDNNISNKVLTYRGGLSPPASMKNNTVLVSTADAFIGLKANNQRSFGWHKFSLVILDEVHHMLKLHPYRKVTLDLRTFQANVVSGEEYKFDLEQEVARLPPQVQILGLSASLTYHVTDTAIRNQLNILCRELDIKTMASPTLQELIGGGYNPPQEDCIHLDVSYQVPQGVTHRSLRKNHSMYEVFRKRIDREEATEFAKKLWNVIRLLEHRAKQFLSTFESPLDDERLKSWEEYANGIRTGRTNLIFSLLEIWYVGLRVLVQTWEEEEQLVLQWLKQNHVFNFTDEDAPELSLAIREIGEWNDGAAVTCWKLFPLRGHLVHHKANFGDSFRCIVFVQQQITAHVLSYALNSDDKLGGELGLRAGYVVSRGSKITPSIKVNKTMAAETIQDFRDGKVHILVATSVIEEGFDVPAANVVVCYDQLKDSVELCQRFGRARQESRAIVVLDERHDRTVEHLELVKSMQERIVQKFDPKVIEIDEELERSRQRRLETSAYRSTLLNKDDWNLHPVKTLNEYVQKTKGTLDMLCDEEDNQYVCHLTYKNVVRTVEHRGSGMSKKEAKAIAALDILIQLEEATRTL